MAGKKMCLKTELMDAIAILKLDKTKMSAVAKRESATKWGIVILAVPFVVNLLLSVLSFPSGFRSMLSRFVFWPSLLPVLALVGAIFAMSLIAQKMFDGKGDHVGYFRVSAYAGVVSWLTVVPYILNLIGAGVGLLGLASLVVSVWMIVVSYHVLQVHHKLNQQDTVISIVGGALVFMVLSAVLGNSLVGGYYNWAGW